MLRRLMAIGAIVLLGGCRDDVKIGSKAFTESVILGNIAADLAANAGSEVSHRQQLGGTRLVWDSLVSGQIDVYPEYTGTLASEIFSTKPLGGEQELREELARHGIEMTRSLGFEDGYALGMRPQSARRLGIRTISDLQRHPQLRLAFSNEFLSRADGWPALKRAYQLPQASVVGIDHDLAYRALANGSIDVTDLYSTDAEIAYYHLDLLEDDLHHFPRYDAVFLYRTDLRQRAPQVVERLKMLEGRIGREQMTEMNEAAKIRKVSEAQLAADFLDQTLHIRSQVIDLPLWPRLKQRTSEHLGLVVPSLSAAIPLAIFLGVVAFRYPRPGQVILGILAALYTLPALALLVFMLPLAGIGWMPAALALFIYSLLPIARNTHAGLQGISPAVRESAMALGLGDFARLWRIELPLASLSILAGIQTAAVLNVGTATLGALIGAGGYGQPIITGIRLNNTAMILEGAVPAALMALLAQWLFDLVAKVAVPRGLRLKPA